MKEFNVDLKIKNIHINNEYLKIVFNSSNNENLCIEASNVVHLSIFERAYEVTFTNLSHHEGFEQSSWYLMMELEAQKELPKFCQSLILKAEQGVVKIYAQEILISNLYE